MERILIIGTGLIGGSLGMAYKSAFAKDKVKFSEIEVVGFDVSWDAANTAKKKNAVDRMERDLEIAVSQAKFVVVATPISIVPEIFRAIAPFLADDAVVTDTASTKGEIMRWAAEMLPPKVSFIGGHPMAGKEVGGIDNASADLFQGSTYCIVPSRNATQNAIDLTVGMARTVGSEHYFIDADEHDMLVAGISHLPLFLSTALMATISKSPSWDEMAKLASSGFRDTSRLASSDLALSRGITQTNKAGIVRWLDEYISVLKDYRRVLDESPEELLAEFERAQVARDKWIINREGKADQDRTEGVPSAGDQFREFIGGDRLMGLFRRQEEEDKKRREERR